MGTSLMDDASRTVVSKVSSDKGVGVVATMPGGVGLAMSGDDGESSCTLVSLSMAADIMVVGDMPTGVPVVVCSEGPLSPERTVVGVCVLVAMALCSGV